MSKSLLPLKFTFFRTSRRDNQSNWFVTSIIDGGMTANILDTTATIIASTGINIIKERNHWFAIDTTPDKGFVLVVNCR